MSELNNLVEWFADKNKVMIALSGGVEGEIGQLHVSQRHRAEIL